MFLMWLGEQITERGVGNGISMIILSGIVAGLPGAIGRTFESVSTGEMNPLFAILLIGIVHRRHRLLRVRRARAAPHHGATTPSARSAAACTPGRAATCRSSSTCRA